MEIKTSEDSIILNLPKDMEKEAFLKLSSELIKLANPVTKHVDEYVTKEPEIKTEHIVLQERPKQAEYKAMNPRDFLSSQDNKLVIGKCECGETYAIKLYEDALKRDHYNFVCKHCEEQNVIEVRELVPATYNCPNCRAKATFWTTAGIETSVACKGCDCEIDLFYNEKKKIMTN